MPKRGGIVINNENTHEFKPGKKKIKSTLAKTILWLLGRGFQACALRDSRVKREVSEWNEGFTVILKIAPNGPSMAVSKRNGQLKFINPQDINDTDISIYFKNIEAALLVLTGRIGVAQAFAEHRFTLKGDIADAMSVVRCMYIIEAYLFPKFITRKILKRMPKKEVSSMRVYLSILF